MKIPNKESLEIVNNVYEACVRRLEAAPPRDYLGMSSIGEPCERKLWFNFNNFPHTRFEGRVARVFDMGHSVEARVIADFETAGYKVEETQLELIDPDNQFFRGHIDGIINGITSKKHILEIKSANDASFKKFVTQGIDCNPKYAAQVQCYMGFTKLERALFVVENKNNQELYVQRVYFNKDEFLNLKTKALNIINGGLPLKNSQAGCYFCEYKETVCEQADVPKCERCNYYIALTAQNLEEMESLKKTWLGKLVLCTNKPIKDVDFSVNGGKLCFAKGLINVPDVNNDSCDYQMRANHV
jgi:hypothetical protein